MAAEPSLHDKDWGGWDADWADDDASPALAVTPGLPVTLTDGMVPLDRDGLYVPNHLDRDGTVHFFAVVDVSTQEDLSDLSSELRYFRAARTAGGEVVHDAHSVMPLDGTSSPFPRPQLELMLEDGDLENAQELAHHTARLHGFDFPLPEALSPLNTAADYAYDGDTEPLEPVTDPIASWMAQADAQREANAALEGAEWFEATFDRPERQLLQPLDDTVNYAVVIQAVDPWTSELAVEKYWKLPGGYLGIDGLTLETFDSDDEAARAKADADRLGLLETVDERGLEGMMHQAELAAMEGGWLDGNRADTRLFRQGPPDRFETLAEHLRDEPNPYWNTDGDRPQTPEPGSWDELITQQTPDEPEPERHYWQIHYRPVETPEGEPLGTALFVTEFPQLPPDFDDYIEENGMDDSVYPTEARTLEMAHFANEDDARKFETEFRSYLVPGLLDGPELAPEVAKLEGLSGEWGDMDYRGIVDYMSGNRTIVREVEDWHLHNPNADKEAREQSEDIFGFTLYEEAQPATKPISPSIDL
ncbi:MAG: hypothetical protein L6Q98_21970 [Anaerolineae bacterium]|nr:hypothetical protein [Anaerolineae bacterium]NUQ06289.1 hypothetical protein [Anaerolineae bacterium]